MKYDDNISQLNSEHDSIDRLLPWYVNNTLSKEERDLVEIHAQSCVRCRASIGELQGLQRIVQKSSDTVPEEPENLQNVLTLIEKGSVEPVIVKPKSRTTKSEGFWAVFFSLPGAWRYSMVVQFLLLVFLLIGVLFYRPSMDPVFTTLSTPAENTANPSRVQMRVVFAEDVLFRDIRLLLVNAQARIVDGPTTSGVYTLETAYEPGEELQEILNRWRNKALVRFVEPVSNIAARN